MLQSDWYCIFLCSVLVTVLITNITKPCPSSKEWAWRQDYWWRVVSGQSPMGYIAPVQYYYLSSAWLKRLQRHSWVGTEHRRLKLETWVEVPKTFEPFSLPKTSTSIATNSFIDYQDTIIIIISNFNESYPPVLSPITALHSSDDQSTILHCNPLPLYWQVFLKPVDVWRWQANCLTLQGHCVTLHSSAAVGRFYSEWGWITICREWEKNNSAQQISLHAQRGSDIRSTKLMGKIYSAGQ